MEIRRHDDLDDLAAALEAHNRAWRVGFRGIVPQAVIESQLRETDDAALAVLDQEIADEAGPFAIAEVDGEIVGFVRARYASTADFVEGLGGEIRELIVDPAHWRDGVGTALLGTAVDWLPEMIDGLSVCVLADNDRARSFLEANDLVFEGTTEAELGGETFEHAIYRVGFEG